MKREMMEMVRSEEVLRTLDAQAPNWAVRLADQQDLKDALQLEPARGRELLRKRSEEKVWMVVRAFAAVLLEKEQKAWKVE